MAALGAALAALAVILVGYRVARALAARLGPVEGPGDPWLPSGDGRAVLVELPGDGTPTRVELPEGIDAREVDRVQAIPGGEVVVQVLHAPRDRRAMLGGQP